ncbi:hypothetical protein NLG97_g2294 [Lecanicillium saksenae]|uniref:Uncharacterized protein n=1 Tax=Lecanicillium saksenae TaxID=468837 RepID=A0ACC1R4Q5_9HYPO|nr:hypothetical protein NLG97_g2294 [Lecanicillium saksenae]
MKSFTPVVLAAVAAHVSAKSFQVALTGYYNGIDTIGGSGSTAHFKGVKVNCVGGDKKELCTADDSGITFKGDKDQAIDCNGLALHYKATLNCGKEKIESCTANAPGAKTVKENDLHGGYSNIGIGSFEVSQCVSVVKINFDDAIPAPC